MKDNMTGISEFKHKVNIMLQNQMYLNMNGKEPSKQFETRKSDNIWGSKDLESQIQHVPGMGYGYVLGLNDLRDLKDKRKDEYDDIYHANYENILLKNNRNQSVRKTNAEGEFEGLNGLSNTPGGGDRTRDMYSL